jgi:hypothetical protein
MIRAALVGIVLLLAACASPAKPALPPAAFRVETVLYELPLASAEALYRTADPNEATLGFDADLTASRTKLEELARRDPAVRRVMRPDLVLDPGKDGRVPPRLQHDLDSDRLEIDVRVSIVEHEWAPLRLELSLRRLAADGSELASLPRGSALLPESAAMRFVCLPPRERAGSQHAIVGFVRPVGLAALDAQRARR